MLQVSHRVVSALLASLFLQNSSDNESTSKKIVRTSKRSFSALAIVSAGRVSDYSGIHCRVTECNVKDHKPSSCSNRRLWSPFEFSDLHDCIKHWMSGVSTNAVGSFSFSSC